MDYNMKAFKDAFYQRQADKVNALTEYLKDFVAGRYAPLWTLWRWEYIFKTVWRRIRKVFISERSGR